MDCHSFLQPIFKNPDYYDYFKAVRSCKTQRWLGTKVYNFWFDSSSIRQTWAREASYAVLLDKIRTEGVNFKKDATQLYKRMVFYVIDEKISLTPAANPSYALKS